jgi:hypothetical protein
MFLVEISLLQSDIVISEIYYKINEFWEENGKKDLHNYENKCYCIEKVEGLFGLNQLIELNNHFYNFFKNKK